ncbi:C2 domain-containing protein [Mycena indigotica]|uniref:C2 domain-containing protein n=1 Tax=Mycena indigotica TaxID=2126181 RepID=A0A8H6WEP7_9AGAR|nr:C2 domain-containing protein [Mycena indigotica]KAF7312078.1 C2 domain-containing protein [Mycena indigotica]
MSKEEIGTLVIVVLKARNLNDKYFWKQDVFAQVNLNGDKKQTHVEVKGGQHPVWDEEIRVPIFKDTHEKYRKLEVSCWAKEPRKETNIGAGTLDISETLRTGEFDVLLDWIALESNGVTRGDVYLEMTFFASTPAPAGHGLSVPKPNSSNLQRRPSKLSPAERLSRPPQSEILPLVNQQQDQRRHPSQSPPSSKQPSPSPPRLGRESPLPPVPEQQSSPPVPGSLTPGRPRPAVQGNTLGLSPGGQEGAAPGLTPHVPSILRPRNPKSSPTPIPGPRVEYSGVVPAPESGYDSDLPARAYTPVVPPADTPFGWNNDDNQTAPSNFSFPVPSLSGTQSPPVNYTPSPPNGSGPSTPAPYPPPSQPPTLQHQTSYPPPTQPAYQPPSQPSSYPPTPYQPPPTFQSPPPPSFTPAPPGAFPPTTNGQDLPDPYLLKRYQTPLPLPPGAQNETHHRPRTTSHATQVQPAPAPTAPSLPVKPPQQQPPPPSQQQQQSKPTPVAHVNPDNARIQALKQVEEEAARRRAQEKRDHEFALKQAQVEDTRKAQEERDLELARQLDRELNLGVA